MLSPSECAEIERERYNLDKAKYICSMGDVYPKTNIQVYMDDGIEKAFVEIAVPGIDPKFIELAIEQGVLSIRADKVENVVPYQNDNNYGREAEFKLRELHKSSFIRKLDFNKIFEIDEKNISISYNLGMLFIILPSVKDKKDTSRKILDWWKKDV